MSEVAGSLAVQAGAWCLQAQNGGRGVLLSGASGVRPGRVLILGAGIAGANACQIAVGTGAEVTVMDVSAVRMRYLHDILGGHVNTLMSNHAAIEEEIGQADLLIGAVLLPGARTPRLVTRRMVARMKPGAALVDLSIDQGGVSETSRPTTHKQPMYLDGHVVHYCVTNMPAAVPHTSTYALTNATLSYALEIADQGVMEACRNNRRPAPRTQYPRRPRGASRGRAGAGSKSAVTGGMRADAPQAHAGRPFLFPPLSLRASHATGGRDASDQTAGLWCATRDAQLRSCGAPRQFLERGRRKGLCANVFVI